MAWMHISMSLGIPLSEAYRTIDSADYMLYRAYFQLHPPISVRADVNTALIRQTIMSCNASKKSEVPKFEKLMIDYEKEYRNTQHDYKSIEIRERLEQFYRQ